MLRLGCDYLSQPLAQLAEPCCRPCATELGMTSNLALLRRHLRGLRGTRHPSEHSRAPCASAPAGAACDRAWSRALLRTWTWTSCARCLAASELPQFFEHAAQLSTAARVAGRGSRTRLAMGGALRAWRVSSIAKRRCAPQGRIGRLGWPWPFTVLPIALGPKTQIRAEGAAGRRWAGGHLRQHQFSALTIWLTRPPAHFSGGYEMKILL